MSIKPDITNYSSLFQGYGSFATYTQRVTISGSVGAGSFTDFTASFPISSAQTTNIRAEFYIKNPSTGNKAPVTSLRMGTFENIYQFAGAETAVKLATIFSTRIDCTLEIGNNTGSPIVLTTQTIEFSVVLYQLPF